MWSHYYLYVVGNTAYSVKLHGVDLSRYTNKIESVDVRKCPYHYVTKKVMSQYQTFLKACPTSWTENSWHRYGIKKLSHCHPMYIHRGPFKGANSFVCNQGRIYHWATRIVPPLLGSQFKKKFNISKIDTRSASVSL